MPLSPTVEDVGGVPVTHAYDPITNAPMTLSLTEEDVDGVTVPL